MMDQNGCTHEDTYFDMGANVKRCFDCRAVVAEPEPVVLAPRIAQRVAEDLDTHRAMIEPEPVPVVAMVSKVPPPQPHRAEHHHPGQLLGPVATRGQRVRGHGAV